MFSGSNYEHSLNGKPYQSDPIFPQVPNGLHSIITRSTLTGCVAKTSYITVNCVIRYTLQGTVYPFVYHSDEPELNAKFPVTARLYTIPATLPDPFDVITASTPKYTAQAVRYDGTTFIPGTPKNPGKQGFYNNPGLPINWAYVKGPSFVQEPVNNATVAEGETPNLPVGMYTFNAVDPGDYILTLSRPGFVTRYAKITVTGNSFLGHREIIGGDVNNDMIVNGADVIGVDAMNQKDGLPYNPAYDIDGDGEITVWDYVLVKAYLNFTPETYQETYDWVSSIK
jgi:hypothetical protein